MNLIPSGQAVFFQTAIQNLWDSLEIPVTIVKEALITPVNINLGGHLAGYENTYNINNYTFQPVSGTFFSLIIDIKPDGKMDYLSQKQKVITDVFIKLQQDGRDFLMDGRKNMYIILENKQYAVVSEESVAYMINKPFFIFKLSLIK